jgi:threonyl-tRNA synthetase
LFWGKSEQEWPVYRSPDFYWEEVMRLLGVHSDGFGYGVKEQATVSADSLAGKPREIKIESNCLVVFTAIEDGDNTTLTTRATTDITDRARQRGVKDIVVYPYVHLTDNPAPLDLARSLLDTISNGFSDDLNITQAPFGWYKSFELTCLGHPLSEWSARYDASSVDQPEQEGRKGSEFTRFIIADPNGEAYEVSPKTFKDCPAISRSKLLRQFVTNELVGREDKGESPKHVDLMRRHELVDYCDVSEKGHHKWYPKGVLIRQLLLDYAGKLARDWGAFEMRNPVLIRGDHNAVGELMGEFHERDYRVDGGSGTCYLRYASDPLGFPFMQNVRFSHKQTPLKVYEEASCFRNEQEGEVSGLKRVRNFTMTDMHAACDSATQAREEFEFLCYRFAGLMDEIIAPGRWVLDWEGTIEFYEANKEWLIAIGQKIGVPAFFKLMPEMSHYYVIKNEFQAITADGSNVQVSTVQWDVKDGERFDIGYFDDRGKKTPCPVIVHASSFGSIERTLCAMLESSAISAQTGGVAAFPTWLSPTQVRIIPVSDDELTFSDEIQNQIASSGIRVDVDDREDTVGRKIRNAEREWIPYIIVLGPRETESGVITIRRRETRDQIESSIPALLKEIKTITQDTPTRPLPLPARLTRRPTFFG